MKVLYTNHTSEVSGGERSLLDLLNALPDDVEAHIASPPGPLASAAASAGVPVSPINGTTGSLRMHPLHTPRGVADLARDGFAISRLASRLGADVVHANSIRAGLAGALARRLGGPPTAIHVRDVLPEGRMSSAALAAIGRGADVLVANSAYTAARVRRARVRAPVQVVHSPVDLERFDPSTLDREAARAALGLNADVSTLAVIAQITPWKGQAEAVRILRSLHDDGIGARLWLVGSTKFMHAATRYDNKAYLRELRSLADELEVADAVEFFGEREDIPQILAGVDLLLAPSWEEPFGRSVVEAMAMGVPVVATAVGGPAEVITDGETGVLLPPRDPQRWASRVAELLVSAKAREEMGSRACAHARENFSSARHAAEMVTIYRQIAEAGR